MNQEKQAVRLYGISFLPPFLVEALFWGCALHLGL
jgi:hypothetical protein